MLKKADQQTALLTEGNMQQHMQMACVKAPLDSESKQHVLAQQSAHFEPKAVLRRLL